jgi:molybdopterin-guanine dinucleotide biosynthesis protein
MADINGKRLEGHRFTPVIDEVSGQEALANYLSSTGRKFWEHEPNLGDLVDGLSTHLDARVIEGFKHRALRIPRKRPPRAVVHRRQKIQALGNAVVPQVAEFLGQQIIKHHRKELHV